MLGDKHARVWPAVDQFRNSIGHYQLSCKVVTMATANYITELAKHVDKELAYKICMK